MNSPHRPISPSQPPHKYGAVAVIRRDQKWLLIRRSALVRAPRKLCFPGGTIEQGELEIDTVRRELQEELGVLVSPQHCVWRSVTSWGVALTWWSADLPAERTLQPHAAEVEAFMWLDTQEALAHPDLLESAREFFEAFLSGRIDLERDFDLVNTTGGHPT